MSEVWSWKGAEAETEHPRKLPRNLKMMDLGTSKGPGAPTLPHSAIPWEDSAGAHTNGHIRSDSGDGEGRVS